MYSVTMVVRDYVLLTLILEVPPSCPTGMPLLPTLKLPKQNRAYTLRRPVMGEVLST